MNVENNIYKRPAARVTGMSSRQQVLYLLQKTQKEANWNMDNDSDFYDEYSQETDTQQHNSAQNINSNQAKRQINSYLLPFNQEFEFKREKLRHQELKDHPERFRLLAHSLSQFIPIKKNKYLERKRYMLSEKEASSQLVCNCQKASSKKNEKTSPMQSFNCGERCINRCVSTECCGSTCPSGPFCKNRQFQLHQNAYVFPAKTEKKGYGLFAGEFIPKGTFIMQYVGEVFSVDTDLGQKRVLDYRKSTCTYLMRTTNNEVIDPTYIGNIARFINHSCEPNCETQKWNVLGEVCVGIFALRDIHENEELSFDYQFDFFKTPFTKCYCGTSKCKGYLGVLSKITDNEDEEFENPTCTFCAEYINEKDDLLVCNGACRETFHLLCIIKKEGKTKTQAQALMQQSDRRNFICRDCIVNSRKKRGRKLQKEDSQTHHHGAGSSSQSLSITRFQQMHLSQQFENILENPQEDKDDIELEMDVPPWESTDPEIIKFFQDNPQNRELDMIIKREFEIIQANLKAINEAPSNGGGNSKLKRAKKKNMQFSEHYNFMSEFQKRLKMRLDGDKANYKFRKFKDDIQEMKRLKQQQIEAKRHQRQLKLQAQQLKQQKLLNQQQKQISKPQHQQQTEINQLNHTLQNVQNYEQLKSNSSSNIKQIQNSKQQQQYQSEDVKKRRGRPKKLLSSQLLIKQASIVQAASSLQLQHSKSVKATGQDPNEPPIFVDNSQIQQIIDPLLLDIDDNYQQQLIQQHDNLNFNDGIKMSSNAHFGEMVVDYYHQNQLQHQLDVQNIYQQQFVPYENLLNQKRNKLRFMSKDFKEDEEDNENFSIEDKEFLGSGAVEDDLQNDYYFQSAKVAQDIQNKDIQFGEEQKLNDEVNQEEQEEEEVEEEDMCEEEEEMEEEEVEEEEDEEVMDTIEDVEDSEDDDDDEEQDLESEQEQEDQEEDDIETTHNDELKLEDLQGQYEKEIEEKKYGGRNLTTTKQQSLNLFNTRRLRVQSGDSDLVVLTGTKRLRPGRPSTKQNNISPRKPLNSSYAPTQMTLGNSSQSYLQQQTLSQLTPHDLQAQEKQKIVLYTQQKIEEFLDQQLKSSTSLSPSELIVRESKFNVFEPAFNLVVPDNIDALQCLPTKFQIFWEQAWGGVVTVRLQSTLKQYQFMTLLLQEVTDMLYKAHLLQGHQSSSIAQFVSNLNPFFNHSQATKIDQLTKKDSKEFKLPFLIVMVKVPKNFIRKLVGYQEKTLTEYCKYYQVDFYFDRDLLTDDVFQMNETAELRIFGKSQDVMAVNELVQKELEQIKMKTILLQMNDCKLLMDNVKEVKAQVDPCEIRVKRMTREWKDIRHPFYYLPNYFREMSLIGKETEIKEAEQRIEQFFVGKRDVNWVNSQQISFLLPIMFKSMSSDIKIQINLRCPQVQIFLYDPTYPRKHLTVLMIGPWIALLQAKLVLEELANVQLLRNGHSFDGFQQFTYHQQIRFSFKSLKRFVLERDIKYLNHWDLCSIFVENAGKPVPNFDWTTFLNEPPKSSQVPKLTFNPLLVDPSKLQIIQQQQQQKQNIALYYGVHSNQSSLFHHQQVANQQQIEALIKEAQEERKRDFKALIQFLKEQDVETCINSIFVLVDSNNSEESLKDLMTRLQVSKKDLIQYMLIMLSKNINDYECVLKLIASSGFNNSYGSHHYSYGYHNNSRYEPIKVIEQENNSQSEPLVISQSREAGRRYQGYHAYISQKYYRHDESSVGGGKSPSKHESHSHRHRSKSSRSSSKSPQNYGGVRSSKTVTTRDRDRSHMQSDRASRNRHASKDHKSISNEKELKVQMSGKGEERIQSIKDFNQIKIIEEEKESRKQLKERSQDKQRNKNRHKSSSSSSKSPQRRDQNEIIDSPDFTRPKLKVHSSHHQNKHSHSRERSVFGYQKHTRHGEERSKSRRSHNREERSNSKRQRHSRRKEKRVSSSRRSSQSSKDSNVSRHRARKRGRERNPDRSGKQYYKHFYHGGQWNNKSSKEHHHQRSRSRKSSSSSRDRNRAVYRRSRSSSRHHYHKSRRDYPSQRRRHHRSRSLSSRSKYQDHRTSRTHHPSSRFSRRNHQGSRSSSRSQEHKGSIEQKNHGTSNSGTQEPSINFYSAISNHSDPYHSLRPLQGSNRVKNKRGFDDVVGQKNNSKNLNDGQIAKEANINILISLNKQDVTKINDSGNQECTNMSQNKDLGQGESSAIKLSQSEEGQI